MYAGILRAFAHSLANLDAILAKAEESAAARGFSPDVFLTARLAPDMFTFTRQVQIACDSAKLTAARIADVPPPSFPDTEATFADLRARVTKTREWIAALDAEAADAQDGSRIVPAGFPPDKHLRLQDYVLHRQIPNFYFHMTTAYALLRHWGVGVGKGDFIGALSYTD